MTRSNTFNSMKAEFCKFSISCDAAQLGEARIGKGICAKCEETQKKRAKTRILRGSHLTSSKTENK